MVQSNEFTGATLAEAARKATEAYRKDSIIEVKSFCENLRSKFDFKNLEADRIFDRVSDMEREVDSLKQQARDAELAAILAALSTAAGALGSILRALRKYKNLKLDKFMKEELLELVPYIGGAFATGLAAMSAASALKEARRLEREIERLRDRFDRLAGEMISITQSYERGNCHLGSGIA